MESMIDHYYMAVVMTQECVDKAVHEELAAMCEDIVAVQTAQIEKRQTWLRERYGSSSEPHVSTEGVAASELWKPLLASP